LKVTTQKAKLNKMLIFLINLKFLGYTILINKMRVKKSASRENFLPKCIYFLFFANFFAKKYSLLAQNLTADFFLYL
jgi:hypothetical protein